MTALVLSLYPIGKKASKQQALSWDQVRTDFYKLGTYGYSGMNKNKKPGQTNFHIIMRFVLAGTNHACKKLWQDPDTCRKLAQITKDGLLGVRLRIKSLLNEIGIEAVFYPAGSPLEGFFGIHLKEIQSRGKPEDDLQRIEHSDFVNALAWAKEDLLTQ